MGWPIWSWISFRDKNFCSPIAQRGSGPHSASYSMATGVMAQDRLRPEIEAQQSPLFNAEVFHMHSWLGMGKVYICLLLSVTSEQFPVPFFHMQRHQGNHLKASVERHTCCATRVVKWLVSPKTTYVIETCCKFHCKERHSHFVKVPWWRVYCVDTAGVGKQHAQRNEVTRGRRKLHNEELHTNLYRIFWSSNWGWWDG